MDIRWIKHDNVTSTNRVVSELLKHQKPKEELVVIADYQESGKGQGANSWHSREGENLLMSLLLFPAFLSASSQFHLSRVVSVSICEVLDILGTAAVIKWPNDILTSRGKIAGILIEHGISGGRISHTIAGIGLNLNQSEFPEFPQPATSLFLETGRKAGPQEVAVILVERIMSRYQKLKEGYEQVLEKEYLERLFLLGKRSQFEVEGVVFEGIVRGVSEFGELLVEREGEVVPYGHGEIALNVAGQAK
jgi:BirA family biotin operon repressor/biotin-[acetyl-CoA-carboxylase] ligase